MRNIPGTNTILGYCTNVHAGANWAQTRANLERYAASVKQIVSPNQPMGIGLWFSHASLNDLLTRNAEHEVAALCQTLGLEPFTLNGFPFGDFHQPIVKHAVYVPAWDQPERTQYTLDLARLLTRLSRPGDERSISTVPIGWRDASQPVDLQQAIANLRFVAEQLKNLHAETGVMIHLDIEPEPGCIVQKCDDVVQLFSQLTHRSDETTIYRHIRVCHDVCHAAVMFEDQADVIRAYANAGIRIGKVQLSNAVRADLRNFSARERTEAVAQLREFGEDRYLHQTTIARNGDITFFDDLPLALREFGATDDAGDEWRVHFHVPVYLKSFGLLTTTSDSIIECMRLLRDSDVTHWEVETYAWNVLPEELQAGDLAEGIARELQWVREQAIAEQLHS